MKVPITGCFESFCQPYIIQAKTFADGPHDTSESTLLVMDSSRWVPSIDLKELIKWVRENRPDLLE